MKRISQRTVITVLSFVLLVQGYSAWTEYSKPKPQREYKLIRADMVASSARSAGAVETVLLGDSITESIWLNELCGTTLNASVAGNTIDQSSALAARIFGHVAADKIIVAIGTNDAKNKQLGHADFERRYDDMLAKLPIRPFALVGIGNSENANAVVKAKAAEIGAVFIPPLEPSLTSDGIHPTDEGRIVWRERVENACPKRLENPVA